MSTLETSHQQEVAQQGAEDAGRFFRYMAEFVGFTEADAAVVRQTKPLIEKHLPEIIGEFYNHVLRYPPTRKFFLKKDGTLDQPYLELRMRHLSNFWLRTAEGVFDDDYARYVDYVGRAHTSRGADPAIYIAERYVIGQVGMMQHAISEAISRELRNVDDETEFRAGEAWDKLMMVILELLARAYGQERAPETYDSLIPVDQTMVAQVAAAAVEEEQKKNQPVPTHDVVVGALAEIPDGDRKIIEVDGLSIGVFHHNGCWFALHNSCLHRGGPVATGKLDGDILTCPWHGFQYDITSGKCLADPAARLDTYAVTVADGQVHLQVPIAPDPASISAPIPAAQPGTANAAPGATGAPAEALPANAFRTAELQPGKIKKVVVDGKDVAVYNVDGAFYATQNACTHVGGPLSEGDLAGNVVTCFLHGSCFNVTNGAVVKGPAQGPLKTYRVTVDGEIGRVTAA